MEAITSFPIEGWLGVGAIVWGLVSSRVALPASIKGAIDAIFKRAPRPAIDDSTAPPPTPAEALAAIHVLRRFAVARGWSLTAFQGALGDLAKELIGGLVSPVKEVAPQGGASND